MPLRYPSAEGWRGDGWHGRRLRWFEGRVGYLVATMLLESEWSQEQLVACTEEMTADPGRFAYKLADPHYRGKDFSAWTWRIDETALAKAVTAWKQRARGQVVGPPIEKPWRAWEVERYPTLEDWLSALHRNRVLPPPPEEESLGQVLTRAASDFGRASKLVLSFLEKHRARLSRWPRVCRSCGATFTWAEVGRRNVVRCGSCLPKRGRGKREGTER